MAGAHALRSFFRIGYHKKIERPSGVVIQQDGFIASMMLGMLVTALLIGLSSSRYLLRAQKYMFVIDMFFVQIGLILLLAVNIIGLIFVMCHTKTHTALNAVAGTEQSDTTTFCQNWRQESQRIFPLVGLGTFLVGILFVEVPKWFAFLVCVVTSNQCYERSRGYIGLIYHTLVPVFCVCTFLFVCTHSRTTHAFPSSSFLRYFLGLIVACILFMYFDLETWCFIPNTYHDYCNLPSDQLAPEEQCNCLKGPIFDFANNVEDYLQPFYVEFFLLAAERVVHMFNSMRIADDVEAADVPGKN